MVGQGKMQSDFSNDNSAPAVSATVDGALAGRAPTDNAHADDTPADAAPVNGSLIFKKNGESYRKNKRYDIYRFWYFLSNGVTADVVLHDLDLNFQRHKFETLISGKQ